MNPLAITKNFKVLPLFRRRFGQTPRPCQWYADCPSIHEMSNNFIMSDLNVQ